MWRACAEPVLPCDPAGSYLDRRPSKNVQSPRAYAGYELHIAANIANIVLDHRAGSARFRELRFGALCLS